jgi:hypothetical protein
MRKTLALLALVASVPRAAVDLVAPFDVRLLGSNVLFDTVEITTYLLNKGTTQAVSPVALSPYLAVAIGVDSFNIRSHDIYTLSPGYYLDFTDTITVIRGAHSFHTWCDPLGAWNESNENNNVRSQAVNYRPAVIFDTIVLYDTLVIRDTVRIHDTVKVTVRDTVIKKDTVKYCPPSMAKASAAALRPAVASTVYNAIGQPVWAGALREGEYPPIRLKQGLHLLVQGARVHRFRVAYK